MEEPTAQLERWHNGVIALRHQVEAELGWGKSVVEKLSKDICAEFDGIQGFSPRNIWDMKRFYEQYQGGPILRQLVAEIPWGHNLLILNKITDTKERKYYIQATIDNAWSRNVLLNQIKANAYARHISADKAHNFSKTLPAHLCAEKDTFEIEYSLRNIHKPIGVSEYYLTKNLPTKLKHDLPSPEIFKNKLLQNKETAA